jgi:hypothetical protein
MKLFLSVLLISAILPCTLQPQTSKPIPPGIRQADKLPGPADVPPMNQSQAAHPAAQTMREQARELSDLAQTIPEDVSRFNGGTLPKDMSEKLKRIEKLSKTLRSELSR